MGVEMKFSSYRDKSVSHKNYTSFILSLMIIGLISWTFIAELDEVAVATGKVVPVEGEQVVQHLEGGIIKDIFKREGDFVKKGDNIIELQLGVGSLNKDTLLVERTSLALSRERSRAQAKGVEPNFATFNAPTLAKAEMDIYLSEIKGLETALAVLKQKSIAHAAEKKEIQSKYKTQKADLNKARKQYATHKDLAAEGLYAKQDLITMERDTERLAGDLRTTQASLARMKESGLVFKGDAEQIKSDFITNALGRVKELTTQIAVLDEKIKSADDQDQRSFVQSPVDGVIKSLRSNTIGGVISPTDAVVEIIPSNGELVVEARLSPIDRGYVTLGQEASIKVTSYDFTRYGSLEGEVTKISPTTTVDDNGQSYYQVEIKTKKQNLGENDSLPVTTGMETIVDIKTGSRTVLEFLLKPVIKVAKEGFRER